MRVLVINTLHLKLAGNQALRNCLLGLAEEGHQVIVLQIRGERVLHGMGELHSNISVIHHTIMPLLLRRIVLRIYVAVRAAETWVARNPAWWRNKPGTSDTASALPSGHPVGGGATETITQVLVDKLHWGIFQLKALYYGARIIRSDKIDVVYGYESWGAPAASLLGRIFDVATVTRFQGTFLRPMMGNRLKLLAYFDRVLALKCHADLVVMTNDGSKGNEVLNLFGVPGNRVLFITNGVGKDCETVGHREDIRCELGITLDAHVLLTVSKLALWKRIDRVIRAMPAVVREYDDAILVVVGEGSDKGRLERLARELGVDHSVKFVGAVPHEQVCRYYSAADVFISAYDLSNRGNPVLEALVHGACIVTLADGSVDDIVVNDESGILVDPASAAEALPDAILGLLRDPALRRRLGEGARRIARERLKTWDERNEIEVRRIESLVESRRGERLS